MNLKKANFWMIYMYELQQPGLFTNNFIILNRKKKNLSRLKKVGYKIA